MFACEYVILLISSNKMTNLTCNNIKQYKIFNSFLQYQMTQNSMSFLASKFMEMFMSKWTLTTQSFQIEANFLFTFVLNSL